MGYMDYKVAVMVAVVKTGNMYMPLQSIDIRNGWALVLPSLCFGQYSSSKTAIAPYIVLSC